ncbi:MAG TPA: class I adenylate-forming enzyme family protein [Balneolales bacterium]|nr:class I adenylate-forming enzyme family protein [Balneolales bacterium]
MAYTEELQSKIDQARTLPHYSLPPIKWSNIPDLVRARKHDEKSFITYIDHQDQRTELNYKQFCEKAYALARYLKDKGLKPGDRIATISHNHWHTVVQYFAAWLIGVVVVPINLGEDDERIDYILENGEVKRAFVRDQYLNRIRNIINRNENLRKLELEECGDSLETFIKGYETTGIDEPLHGESDAMIVYTSGTTGKPKAVLLSQRNLLEDARSISEWHQMTEETRMMCVLPIHHVNGTVVTMMSPFYQGGSTVLNQKFHVSRFFPVINEENVHVVSVVPTLLLFLNNEFRDKKTPDTSPLHHIICGAGPLTINVAKNFEDKFKVPIIHGYGLSETTCYSCFIPLNLDKKEHDQWLQDYGYPSIGLPIPANEMQIHDEKGNSVPEKERGEIVIRGVNVMKEYYDNREANEEAFAHGWFRSGDEGFYIKDEDGRPFFFITGRIKELIIRGGVNLAPLEIDEVINRAPGVKSGIAVGFENDWYGEEVGAYVELMEGYKQKKKKILEYCRKHLPYDKCPKVVVFGKNIPVTSTGKYQRMKVAPLFKKWKSVQFRKNGGVTTESTKI